MLVLLIVGVALVVLGALVLLKFPDRPGGRVAFGKTEVSSKGAGLPLVVIGVVCLIVGVRGGAGVAGDGKTGGTPTPAATPAATTTPKPASRLTRDDCGSAAHPPTKVSLDVPVGKRNMRVWVGENLPQAVRLRLFDGADFVGALLLAVEPGDPPSFGALAVLDGDCLPVAGSVNEATGIDPRGRLGNWDTLRFTTGGTTYRIRLGFDPASGLEINHFDKAQAVPPR